MLALSKKQMLVLFIIIVSFIATLAVSTAIIRETNPSFFFHIQQFVMGSGYH